MVFPIVGGTQSTGYEISNSLRFNNNDTAYLNISRSSQSNTTGTFSVWTKMGVPSDDNVLFGGATDVNNRSYIYFSDPDGFVGIFSRTSGSADIAYNSNAKFRDPSAWYHVVVAIDTTQGTAGNRFKMYINGTQYTDWGTATAPSENASLPILNQSAQTVGGGFGASGISSMAEGYLADAYYIDGQQLDASYFGETNDNGVWIPKKYLGTYGTNGFKLEFQQTGTGTASASTIGADTSGNDNHLTSNNLAATDVTTDTPTNNFCTINSVFADAGTNTVAADYSEGNTKLLKTVDAWGHGRGTFLLSSGKWYAEAKVTETGTGEAGQFGIVPSVLSGTTDANDKIEGLRVNMGGSSTIFQKMDTGTGSNVFTDFASGDIVMLAIDLDNNKLWVGNDGTWYNNNNASTTLSPSNHDVTLPSNDVGWIFTIGGYTDGGNNLAWEFNWGNPSFSISSSNADANGYGNMEFAVPSGFYTCCTKNLAEYG
jgi:hypothetical protein